MVAFVLDSSFSLSLFSSKLRSDSSQCSDSVSENICGMFPSLTCTQSSASYVHRSSILAVQTTNVRSSQRNLLAAIFFCAATGLAKGSILLFYLRIFPGRYIVITVWSLFAFVIGYSLAGVFANIFSCNPVSASWSLEDAATAVCMNRPAFYFAQAALGIFTDIATVLTPVPLLKGLQLRTRRKVGVALVLTLGGL